MTYFEKLVSYIKSRTILTIIVMVIINGVPSVRDLIPADWLGIVDVVLGLLGSYFRIQAKQKFE